MKRSIILTLFCFLITLPLLSSLVAQETGIDTQKLDQYFTALYENDRFMGSVAVLDGNETVFEAAYGVIDSDETNATTESIYRIGSITKCYTSVMILQLVEEGSLSLETTLDTYYPDLPNAGQITIEQMLRHTSGLVNFTNSPDYMSYFAGEATKDEMLDRFASLGTSFEPGTNSEYSNTAYVLLGYIIEDVTGRSYADVLQERITGPLDLTSTYFASGIDSEMNEADSFVYQQDRWQAASRTNMFIPHGAGAIVSTAEETARFFHALFNGELLSEASLEQMTRFDGQFGLGLLRFPFGERILYGHNGGIDGFQSNSAHYPGDNLTFAVLSNGMNYPFNDVLIGMLSITFGQPFEIPNFEERSAMTLEPSELESYTGVYSSENFPLNIELFIQGENLMAQATGQGSFPLTIYDEKTMAFEQAGIEIVFQDPENGQYTEFRFSQAGQQFDFTRQSSDE